MKHMWLNIVAFIAFLAVEFVALHFMGAFGADSANYALLGVVALAAGALYTRLLATQIHPANA